MQANYTFQQVENLLSLPLKEVYNKLNSFNPVYKQMVTDLQERYTQLTESQCKMALETILATAVLEKEIPQIKKVIIEKKRNEEIQKITYLLAEEGFSKGTNEKEVEATLNGWVDTLKNSYSDHKKSQNLHEFFKSPSDGDPCFNGRFISVTARAAQEAKIPLEALKDACSAVDAIAFPYSNLMIDYRIKQRVDELIGYITTLPNAEEHQKNFEQLQTVELSKMHLVPPEKDELLVMYLKTLPDTEGQHQRFLEEYKSKFQQRISPKKPVFIEYLKTLPEYEAMYKQTVESSKFATIYARAVEMDQVG